LTYSCIGADLRRADPAAYDAQEGNTLIRSQTQRLATLYVLGWAPVVGLPGLPVLLLRVYACSRREALWFGVVVALLLGLPSLQFALRHLFQMEALFWLAVLALLTTWPQRRTLA